jgi:hypothetical protein
VFHINTDENENGSFLPSDKSGKIYVNVRGWPSNHQHSKLTYDQAEHFLLFLDKHASHAVGTHYFLQWSKSNRSKTFLDKVTASDGVVHTNVGQNVTPHNPSLGLFLYHFFHTMSL